VPTASSRIISAKASGSTLGSYLSLDVTRAVMGQSQAATEGYIRALEAAAAPPGL
jgi:hypothetical protein